MFVSLCDELLLFSYREIGLQYDKDSCRSTFGCVCTVSGFYFIYFIETKEAFWLMGSSLDHNV